ncbi:arginine decarboxylase, pyruvoyl-dependent [bacterium]|nr:arginine decarboxylase, pyruvoyl-dependent [bacterium]
MEIEPPKHLYIAAGSAEGITSLNAFDGALIDAGIGHYNLVRVTSVVPPNVEIMLELGPSAGSVVPAAFGSIHSVTPDELIAAAVAVALPRDRSKHGLIMEYSARGHKEESEEIVRKMAREGMKLRGFEIGELFSRSIEHRVIRIGCVIAAALLW